MNYHAALECKQQKVKLVFMLCYTMFRKKTTVAIYFREVLFQNLPFYFCCLNALELCGIKLTFIK